MGTLWTDDFEDGDVSDWSTTGTMSFTASENTPKHGTYCGRGAVGATSGSDAYHSFTRKTSGELIVIFYWARIGSTAYLAVHIEDGQGTCIGCRIFMRGTSGRPMAVYENGNWHTLLPSTNNNQMYKVKAVIDLSAWTADYYVDDVLKASNVPLHGSPTGLDYFRADGYINAVFHLDDIAITTPEEFKRTYTETLNLSGVHIKKPTKVFAETLSLSDVHVKKAGKTFTEALTLSDVYSRVWVLYRTYSETLGLSDVLLKKPAKTFAESTVLSDVHIKKASKFFSETLTLSDVYSRVWRLYRTYTETLGLADVVQKKTLKTFLEALTLSDFLQKKVSKAFTESLGLSDVLQKKPRKVFVETLNLSDALTKKLSKTFTETLALSDIYTRTWTLYRTYLETLVLEDFVAKKTAKTFFETLSLRDLPRTWIVNPLQLERYLKKLGQLEDINSD